MFVKHGDLESNSFVQCEEIREYLKNYSLLARVHYKAEFMLKACFCFRNR